MRKAILIDEREQERDYQLPNGLVVTLILEDDFSSIKFYDSNKHELDGEFEFYDEDEQGKSCLLRRMYVPSDLKKLGLGRATLEFFKDYTHMKLYARENDGVVRDDGSHLTEDAPGFVRKMKGEGLIMGS